MHAIANGTNADADSYPANLITYCNRGHTKYGFLDMNYYYLGALSQLTKFKYF